MIKIISFIDRLTSNKIRYVLYFLSFWLLCSVLWIIKIFGNPSYEQILFHLLYQTSDLSNFDKNMLVGYSRYALIVPIALLLMFAFIEHIIQNQLNKNNKFVKLVVRVLPAVPAFVGIAISFAYFGGDTGYAGHVGAAQFNTYNPVFSNKLIERNPNYFAKNYINPRQITYTEQKNKKNLILIYVESLEKGYTNSNIFGADLIKELTELKGISFNSFNQAPGTGWTIAGVVATQCAVPLKVVFMRDGNGQGDGKSFLTNAICLGDVLQAHGYKNIFMNGPSVTFAGVDKFLKSHGYTETYGKEEWLASNKYTEKDFNYWGLQDDDLFLEARIKLDQLVRAKNPFNLTLLTVNTHGPDGFLSASCRRNGGKDFTDIIKCTSTEVANFIKYIKEKGYDSNTDIVILGDHLSIPNPVIESLKSDPDRSIYNLIVTKSSITKSREKILHFDFAPIILDLVGIKVDGGKFGLGYSAISITDVAPPESRLEDMHRDLLNISPEYMNLWLPK